MSMHVTNSATGLYMENVWLWMADHDMDDSSVMQITIYAGRGLLSKAELESCGCTEQLLNITCFTDTSLSIPRTSLPDRYRRRLPITILMLRVHFLWLGHSVILTLELGN